MSYYDDSLIWLGRFTMILHGRKKRGKLKSKAFERGIKYKFARAHDVEHHLENCRDKAPFGFNQTLPKGTGYSLAGRKKRKYHSSYAFKKGRDSADRYLRRHDHSFYTSCDKLNLGIEKR